MAKLGKGLDSPEILSAALEGLECQRQRIVEQIAQVRSMLGSRNEGPALSTDTAEQPSRRQLSAAARKRIAMAQKRRWAEYRKRSGRK